MATQDRWIMVESSDKTWSTVEGNGKPFHHACLENPKNSMKNVPLISLIFLKRCLVFPILLFSSISLHWWLRKAFLSLLATLWNSEFKWVYLSFSLPFFSQLFVRPPQTVILLFCISFSWGCSWSLSPLQCHKPPSMVLQALYLPDLILKYICHFHCIVVRDLI